MGKRMENEPRISNEWVVGATAGAYVLLPLVLHLWGSAFIYEWCGNSLYPPSTTDGRFPFYLSYLIPGGVMGLLGWAQMKVAQRGAQLISHRTVRIALWMNFAGILALLIAVAGNYGPERISYFSFIGVLGLAVLPVGLLVSLGNLVWAFIHWVRARQPSMTSFR